MEKKLSNFKWSDAALDMIAARFRALGEANRLKLLMALEKGEQNVSSLVVMTGLAQANVSRHLQALADAGILNRRKDSLNVYYIVADSAIFEMCNHMCGSLKRRIDSQADAFDRGSPERRKRP